MNDSNKTAVITGAAQGIGRRTAELLAENGYAVALADLRSTSEIARGLREKGLAAMDFQGDISDEDTVADLACRVERELGPIDLLVNNAGVSCISPAAETTAQQFRRVLEINLVAPFMLAKTIGGKMIARHRGAIVNVASIAGLLGIADRAAYNASKHGLVGLTRTLAAEWGGRGVRVNAVCPGWVKTEMDVADQSSGGYTDEDIINRVPMARFASTTDIAEAILFLADERKSGFVNGHTLVVDGGWTADGSWESLRLRQR
ncbi:MAG TPA: SDR family oxidoreductase [Candidatus Sulfotelmatobacter sp.]|nr:SDR family oxidoreductase [Candidatus Sulfotelmatobacter sp.]